MSGKTSTETDKVDIFMPIYIGDYLKDTMFLTTEEHGAYLLMLFACWQYGYIPNKASVICRFTGMSEDAWAVSSDTILAYFKQKDGKIFHSRINRELESARAKKKRQSERGKKGADARWNATGNASSIPQAMPQAMPKQCPSPSPSPSPLTTPSKSTNTICAEPDTDSTPEPSILTFGCTGKVREWNLTQIKLNEWKETFDTINVLAQCKVARQWLLDNPQKRKTAAGMTRFLGSWFSREIQKGKTYSAKSKGEYECKIK